MYVYDNDIRAYSTPSVSGYGNVFSKCLTCYSMPITRVLYGYTVSYVLHVSGHVFLMVNTVSYSIPRYSPYDSTIITLYV